MLGQVGTQIKYLATWFFKKYLGEGGIGGGDVGKGERREGTQWKAACLEEISFLYMQAYAKSVHINPP